MNVKVKKELKEYIEFKRRFNFIQKELRGNDETFSYDKEITVTEYEKK